MTEDTYATKLPEAALEAIARQSFATLATVSPAGRPHVAGILYAPVGTTLYVNTYRGSRKARNITENPHVAVSIPVPRLPSFPPAVVQFQGTAEIVAADDAEIVDLVREGHLKAITSHGELENPDGCFLRITPARRLHTYGLGMPIEQLLREPLNAAGTVELDDVHAVAG